MTENEFAAMVVDACILIHRVLGLGLFESVYEAALAYELEKRGLQVSRQQPIPVVYDMIQFEAGFIADIIVEDKVILELKAIENILPVHKKQLLTYLRLTDMRLGLLLNFGAALMKEGIARVANDLD